MYILDTANESGAAIEAGSFIRSSFKTIDEVSVNGMSAAEVFVNKAEAKSQARPLDIG